MSETGTARIMRLSVDPAGVGWTEWRPHCWTSMGDVCRRSRVEGVRLYGTWPIYALQEEYPGAHRVESP